MRKIYLPLLLLLACSLQAQIKVMSYNLRVDFGGDGDNNWIFRREMLGGQIRFHLPDFVGTQEGKANQLAYLLAKELPGYGYVGISRDSSETAGEFSAIFFNMAKFRVIKQSTFWLSETPKKKSKGWDAALERICTYALFEEIASGQKLYVFNTHLDHIGEAARTNSAKLILKKIDELNTEKLPVILTGDFNAEPASEAYKTIVQSMADSRIASKEKPIGPIGTFNGFKFDEPVTKLIDYIFTTKDFDVLKYAVLSDSKDGRYPSDHLPVMVFIDLQKK
jgi:endonuclease/exonuclease/phosphatase family metal-dependent hydrolase